MTGCARRSVIIITLLAVFFCLTAVAGAQTPESAPPPQRARNMQVQYFYIHGALSLGFDAYSSSDIEAIVLEDLDIHSIGFPFQYGLCGGFRNVFQVELSKYSTLAHNIGAGGFVDGEIVSASVPMKLTGTEILFKINPAIWKWKKSTGTRPAQCLFLILGNGDVTYRDNVGDGFEGSSLIYGLEWACVSKCVSFSFGATYQSIKYDTTRLFGIDIPYEVDAKRFLLYVRLGLGFGM